VSHLHSDLLFAKKVLELPGDKVFPMKCFFIIHTVKVISPFVLAPK